MTCDTTITVSETPTAIVVSGGATIIESSPVVVELIVTPSAVTLEVDQSAPTLIEVGVQGPAGPPGPPGPPATLRPSRTLTYDGFDRLVRIDYVDGSFTDLAYDGQDRLVSSIYTDPSIPQTIERVFTYDGNDFLTAVTVTIT